MRGGRKITKAEQYFLYLLKKLPETRTVDGLYGFFLFIACHRRLPTSKPLFNDVLHRLKTSDEILDPLRVFVSDKEFVKLYVKAVVGDEYNVPTLAVLRTEDELRAYDFPHDCVVKATHGAGQTVSRQNGERLDRRKIEKWFRYNRYRIHREANYKFLTPKVIVEPLIFGSTGPADYKFFCLNGAVKLVQVDHDRGTDHKRKMFDPDWNELDFSVRYPKAGGVFERPANFSEMLDVAARLAKPFGFIRIDLYSDGTTCFVGEITNCHGNAAQKFIPAWGEAAASEMIFG